MKGIDCTIGQKVKKDPVQAVFWYKKAAYVGHPFAQFVLANQYSTGNGVGKDLSEAYALHSIAMKGYDAKAAEFARNNRKDLLNEMTREEVKKGERRIDELESMIADGAGR
jgi:TPR repeat protein